MHDRGSRPGGRRRARGARTFRAQSRRIGRRFCCIARANCARAAGWCSQISASTKRATISAIPRASICSMSSPAIGANCCSRADHRSRICQCDVPAVLQDPGRIRRAVPRSRLRRLASAGLRLRHISTMVTPCPYAEEFRRSSQRAAFAKAYVPTLRSWSENVFAGALSARAPEQRAANTRRFLWRL